MKYLYKFSVFIEKTVNDIQKQVKDGQTITVKKPVIKSVPIEFLIKEPNRGEREEAEIVRAAFLSNFIRRGVMPEAVLAKIYSDQGGVENNTDKKKYTDLVESLSTKIGEYSLVLVNEKDNKEKIDKLGEEILDIKKNITSLQYSQKSYFDNTAEYKAKIKLIEYLFTLLTYWKQDEKNEFKQYFDGKTFDDKMNCLEKFESDNDPVYLKIKDVVLFVISAYIHTGGEMKPKIGRAHV